MQKVKNINSENKKLIFVGVLKVTDKKSRIRSRQSGKDPRIRIRTRIRTKMSQILNIAYYESDFHLMATTQLLIKVVIKDLGIYIDGT